MLGKHVKGRAALKEALEVVVVATKSKHILITLLILIGASIPLSAAVLPEERADALYHSYEGGGIQIIGPSILVRKNFANTVSITANYYVDMITGASIDVESTASKYKEERTEYSLGVDYLHDKTTMSIGLTQSDENDFSAKAYHFGISQDFFGDLTTLSLGYNIGADEVRKTGDNTFVDYADRQSFGLSLSQVLTKNWIVNFSTDTISDEGFLNNPYRSVRFLDPSNGSGYSYQPEHYPNTRTSNAFAVRSRYFLPYRAAIKAEYRTFSDTWKIKASNWELGYIHPIGDEWITEFTYRYYEQTEADFYSDLFPYRDATNFRARDKELSAFSNTSIGFGVSYNWNFSETAAIKRLGLNLYWDQLSFDYENFRDVRDTSVGAGQEALYKLDADVIRFFVSLWF
jgi:hypothetical protein